MIRVPNSQSSNSSNDVEGRFAHLLNPIRDLAKNWEIDIAAYLEEYLAELEGITITFNDGATTLNFAQAALLIQGTTCVYSKKVEYLYNLVFQMLDLLSTKRQMQQQQQKIADEAERENSTLPIMEENHFLSLDDIKEQANLEMNENLTSNRRKSSIQLLPCMPTSLIPLEEGEKGNIILYSKKGEILGNKNDYRLNICSIHHTGALLLNMGNNADIGEAPLSSRESEVELENQHGNKPSVNQDFFDNGPTPASPMQLDDKEDDNDPQQENTDPLSLSPLPEVIDGEFPIQNKEVSSTRKESPTSRRSARLQKRLSAEKSKMKVDPWKTEEPHEEKQQCKACKGKSIRLPKKLQQKKSQTRKKVNKPLPYSPVAKFCADAYFSHTPKFPKNQLKIPELLEVEYIYWAEMKARKKFWKSEQKRKKLEEKIAENDEEDINCSDEGDCSDSFGDDDDFSAPMPGAPCAFDVQNDEQQQNLLDPSSGAELQVVSSYEKLVQKYVETYLSNAAQYCQMTELTRRVNEWEDKIKPKLQEEEEHEPFDIHVYGSRVLGYFCDNNRKQTIDFSTICRGKKSWKICRYFLATLQLANMYNIKIDSTGEMDSVELTLLSRKRHHEELQQFDPL